MTTSAPPFRIGGSRRQWLVPAGLVLLSLAPVIGGVVRVSDLAGGELTPENARFVTAPIPVLAHIVGAVPYCLLGAFQFVPAIRRRWPRWHRITGRVLIPCGLVVALSGIWMTVTYDLPAFDGTVVNLSRVALSVAMATFLVLGVTTVRRRDFARHRAWMIRAYAIALGAGTQAFTHLPLMVVGGQPSVGARTVAMLGAWLINIAVAEWVIRRR